MEGKYIVLSKSLEQALGGFELDNQLYDTIEAVKDEAGITAGTLIIAQIVEVAQVTPEEAIERFKSSLTPREEDSRSTREILLSIEGKVDSKE